MKLTGGQIIGAAMKNYGIKYVAGIPGHGCWSMVDAFLEPGSEIDVVQVFHEQSAVHVADGYYRASGKPMAAFTSIGPGAANTVIGLATAYADSVPLLLLTGGPAIHMRGHGTMQEIDRVNFNAFPKVTEPVTKKQFVVNSVQELPFVMHRAFSAMLTGRPGPVHIEIPMDIQAAAAEVSLHDLEARVPTGVAYPDPLAIERSVAALRLSRRPVIVVGGGAITAGAFDDVVRLAEALGAAVVTTWNGKGAFPEDHRLFAGSVGQTGTTHGNYLASNADVLVSIGCKFTDWSASSYRKGVTFSIPPTKLIQIDVDPQEIGKNYPVEVGIVADARIATAQLAEALSGNSVDRTEYHGDVKRVQEEWESMLAARRDSQETPMTSQRPLRDLRSVLPRDGIIVVGSGNTQGAVKQTFPVFGPRTHLTSGTYSSMGWAVPAAIGAKLGRPDRKVVCVLGDGDFLQTLQEIGVAVMYQIPVLFVVQNNSGYMSIRGGQRKQHDRHVASEFATRDGLPYSPDFEGIARNFGLRSWKVSDPALLESTFAEALALDTPSLVEVITARDAAGPFVPGWWDFPIPEYINDERQSEYASARAEEQHQ